MKEMTLREVQLFALEILKDVHEFCVANNIRYSIAYGTLIGAIRHKGFIPWDDDIDIVMPRPDYERFCKTFKSSKGFYLFSPLNGDCYFNYSRVCDLDKTYVHSAAWCKESPTGMWIDIFPLDGVDIKQNRDVEGQILKGIGAKRNASRMPLDKWSRPMPLNYRFKVIVKKILYFNTNNKKIVYDYEKLITKSDYNVESYCGNKSLTTYWKKDFYPKSYFESYTEVEFEGQKFMATSEYDKYLRQIYGDYMQLPPEEKRVRHPQQMYWR